MNVVTVDAVGQLVGDDLSVQCRAGNPTWLATHAPAECHSPLLEQLLAARTVRDDVLVLVHGGPVSSPEDARYVLSRTSSCHGFYGASSMERLPTERALTEETRHFKQIRAGRPAG